MCGFAGFWRQAGEGDGDPRELLVRMNDAIRYRGPDDEGYWCDAAAGVALGHRRLSILDLSPLGHQPMASASGRWHVVFNGEIYNFAPLRRELEGLGHSFRGHSDTEVLLAAVEQWGVVPAVQRFAGMFALALWDREERALHLVRDRLGEKPLYYGWMGGTLLFGSELKALRAHPSWRGEIDRGVLALFLRHNYVPAPHSIYRGVRKALPGTVTTIRADAPGAEPAVTTYWSAREAAERGIAHPLRGTAADSADALDALLREVVRDEMVSDVPLGAFLSGGVDSSAVVGVMQAISDRPVRTFTIGFEDPRFNEAEHAKAVARHLGTDHTELVVTARQALDVIPSLPRFFDEPFADSSQIPTFLVAQLARRNVTVSLSGDGGDELFAGYPWHRHVETAWNGARRLPSWARQLAAGALTSVSSGAWDSLFRAAGTVVPRVGDMTGVGDRLYQRAGIYGARSAADVHRALVSQWPDPERVVRGAHEPPTAFTDPARWPAIEGRTEQAMHLDMVTYLPDDVMVKVDRSSMAVSLESRAPFLDHRIVELAWRIPLEHKLAGGQGKRVLRDVLDRYVPRTLIERPKQGFAVPLAAWLRGPLQHWAEELLSEPRLRADGFFDAALVRRRWAEHRSGRQDRHHQLWPILMFQAWLDEERAESGARAAASVQVVDIVPSTR